MEGPPSGPLASVFLPIRPRSFIGRWSNESDNLACSIPFSIQDQLAQMAPAWGLSSSGSSKGPAHRSRPSKTTTTTPKASKGKARKSSSDEYSGSEEPSEKPGDGPMKSSNISCIISVENLSPVYEKGQVPATTSQGNWDPPRITSQFSKAGRSMFRWQNGEINVLSTTDPVVGQPWTRRETASVFPQSPTGQLLVVDVDAEQEDVSESCCGRWTALKFQRKKVDGSRGSYYSYLDFVADRAETAARIQNHHVPQLLPEIHNSRNVKHEHAGLIGKLPLLIALAALSGASNVRDPVMRACIQPGRWAQHTQTRCGRDELGHGIVVRIYYDPANPEYSHSAALDQVEDGEFGAFYGPN